MKQGKWSDEDIDFVRNNFPKAIGDYGKLAQALGRSIESVRHICRKIRQSNATIIKTTPQRKEEIVPPPRKEIQLIAILSDLHFPFQNQEFVDRACAEIKEKKPDVIVVDGDVLDFPGLSKYGVSPTIASSTLESQCDMAISFFADLRFENPSADIYFIEGNHDFRIKSYFIRETRNLDKEFRKELYEQIDMHSRLDLDKMGVRFIGSMADSPKWTDTYIDLDGILIGHFDVVANPVIPAGMTVRKILMKYGHYNVVQGHIHRAAIIWDTDMDGKRVFGMEVPALCKPPFYRRVVNWQYGYGLITKTKDGWQPELKVFNP